MAAASERCPSCTKRVYPTEKILIDGIAWHRGCFKCTTCGSTLKPTSGAQYKGKYYCKSHVPVERSERSSTRLYKEEGRDSPIIEKKRSSDDIQQNLKKEEGGDKVLTPKLARPESTSYGLDKKKEKKEKKEKKDKDRDRKERDRKNNNKRSSLQLETNHTSTSLTIPQLNSRLKDSGTLESPTVKPSNSHGDKTPFWWNI